MKFRGTMTISLGPDIVVRELGEEERGGDGAQQLGKVLSAKRRELAWGAHD